MSIFALSDPHLSLAVDKPMDLFGGNWENHAERLRQNWLEQVKPEDTVVMPGDLSWGLREEEAEPDLAFLAGLPGKKVLLKGNHDLWWNSISKLNAKYDSMYFLQNTCYFAENTIICGTRGWLCPGDSGFSADDEKIYKRELGRLRFSLEAGAKLKAEHPDAEFLVAFHYPPFNERQEESGFMDILREFSVKQVIYGHVHGNDAHNRAVRGVRGGILYHLVSCDYLNCMPKRIDSMEGRIF